MVSIMKNTIGDFDDISLGKILDFGLKIWIIWRTNPINKIKAQLDYYITVPPQYKKWNFTSIVSAFEIAEDIIESFNKFKSL